MWYTVCYPVSLNQEFYLYSYVESSVLSFCLFISVTVLTAEDWLRSIESSNLWPPLTFKLCWGNETRRLQNRSCAEPLQELEKWPRMPNNVSSVFFKCKYLKAADYQATLYSRADRVLGTHLFLGKIFNYERSHWNNLNSNVNINVLFVLYWNVIMCCFPLGIHLTNNAD